MYWNLEKKITSSYILAQQSLEKLGEKSRTYTNRARKLVRFRPNDKVLVLLLDKNNKLLIPWKGPLVVGKTGLSC